jgi:predicted nucleic acid-binding protein
MIVVDASVAIKWNLIESDSESAAELLTCGVALFAPELLRVEGAGAFTRARRNGRLRAEDLPRVVDAWLTNVEGGAIQLSPDRLDLRRAAAMSLELRHPLPDCLYLALAERLSAELVTADTTFAKRAPAAYPRVRLLGTAGA